MGDIMFDGQSLQSTSPLSLTRRVSTSDFGGGEAGQSFVEKDIAIASLQEESNNFLQSVSSFFTAWDMKLTRQARFAQRKIEADPDRDLLFSDIVPIASESPSAAAYGLYHLLALVTKNLVKVEQQEPYGEVRFYPFVFVLVSFNKADDRAHRYRFESKSSSEVL